MKYFDDFSATLYVKNRISMSPWLSRDDRHNYTGMDFVLMKKSQNNNNSEQINNNNKNTYGNH